MDEQPEKKQEEWVYMYKLQICWESKFMPTNIWSKKNDQKQKKKKHQTNKKKE